MADSGENRVTISRFLLVIFIVLSIGTAYQVWQQNSALDETQARAQRLEDSQSISQQQAALLAEQIKDLGARPVVKPEDLKDALDNLDLPAGTPVISDAAIALAVFNYCSGDRCAKEPTPAQVAAAVATYCNARGECKGAVGKTGLPGETGATGATGATGSQGPAGPPPSDSQVLDAVRVYCDAHNGCRGEKGDPGAPGRGISRVECDASTQEFVIYYTDDQSEHVAGSDCVAGNGNGLPVEP